MKLRVLRVIIIRDDQVSLLINFSILCNFIIPTILLFAQFYSSRNFILIKNLNKCLNCRDIKFYIAPENGRIAPIIVVPSLKRETDNRNSLISKNLARNGADRHTSVSWCALPLS